jgi:hypothetical protein
MGEKMLKTAKTEEDRRFEKKDKHITAHIRKKAMF